MITHAAHADTASAPGISGAKFFPLSQASRVKSLPVRSVARTPASTPVVPPGKSAARQREDMTEAQAKLLLSIYSPRD